MQYQKNNSLVWAPLTLSLCWTGHMRPIYCTDPLVYHVRFIQHVLKASCWFCLSYMWLFMRWASHTHLVQVQLMGPPAYTSFHSKCLRGQSTHNLDNQRVVYKLLWRNLMNQERLRTKKCSKSDDTFLCGLILGCPAKIWQLHQSSSHSVRQAPDREKFCFTVRQWFKKKKKIAD